MHALLLYMAAWFITEAHCPAYSLTPMTALLDKQAPSSVEQPAIANGEQTIITPFVSASRRLLERCAAFLGYTRVGCCLALLL